MMNNQRHTRWKFIIKNILRFIYYIYIYVYKKLIRLCDQFSFLVLVLLLFGARVFSGLLQFEVLLILIRKLPVGCRSRARAKRISTVRIRRAEALLILYEKHIYVVVYYRGEIIRNHFCILDSVYLYYQLLLRIFLILFRLPMWFPVRKSWHRALVARNRTKRKRAPSLAEELGTRLKMAAMFSNVRGEHRLPPKHYIALYLKKKINRIFILNTDWISSNNININITKISY